MRRQQASVRDSRGPATSAYAVCHAAYAALQDMQAMCIAKCGEMHTEEAQCAMLAFNSVPAGMAGAGFASALSLSEPCDCCETNFVRG
jgi:hypothetical protein